MLVHGKCLRTLRFICDICFGCPEDAMCHLDALDRLIEQHHDLFLQCYGAGLATPKLHWLYHLVAMMRKCGCFNTFKNERDHLKVHCTGGHIRRKGIEYEGYVLKRMLLELLQGAPAFVFCPFALCRPNAAPELALALRALIDPLVAYDPHSVLASTEMTCAIGHVKQSMLIALHDHRGGPVALGKATLFASARVMLTSDQLFFAYYQPLVCVQAGVWGLSQAPEQLCACPAHHIVAVLHSAPHRGGQEVKPLLPWRVLQLLTKYG